MGDGEERFSIINEILEETDIPIDIFRPTHVGRNKTLFLEALAFAKRGGKIDIKISRKTESKICKYFITDHIWEKLLKTTQIGARKMCGYSALREPLKPLSIQKCLSPAHYYSQT
jgi:hypothetical protein